MSHPHQSITAPAIRKVICTDGTEIALDKPISTTQAAELIGASCLDTVMLADGVHVMLVDDSGWLRGTPVNEKATALYLQRCAPGTTHKIRGNVVVVPDADFGEVM